MVSLRLSPLAALHWQFLAHAVKTEATAFGITNENDGLLVESLWVPKQECSVVTTETDDGEFNEMAEWAYDNQIAPHRIGKIWLHTHPGTSPTPSGTDEKTFIEKFGNCDWTVMGILAKGGDNYARVKFKAGGGHSFQIPIITMWEELHKSLPNLADLSEKWTEEVKEKIRERVWVTTHTTGQYSGGKFVNGVWEWNNEKKWEKTEWVQKKSGSEGSGSDNTQSGNSQTGTNSSGKMGELVGPNAGKALWELDDFDVEVISSRSEGIPNGPFTDGTNEIPELDEAEIDKIEILQEFEKYMFDTYAMDVDQMTADQLMDGYKDFCEQNGYEFDLDDIFPERAEYYSLDDDDDLKQYDVFDVCIDCGITKKLDNGYCEGCARSRQENKKDEENHVNDLLESEAVHATELHGELIPLCRT